MSGIYAIAFLLIKVRLSRVHSMGQSEQGQSEQISIDWRDSIMTACTIIKTESKQDLESSITDSQTHKQMKQIAFLVVISCGSWMAIQSGTSRSQPPSCVCFLGPSAQPSGILHSSYSLELSVPLITDAGLGWTAEQMAQHCWGTESRERKDVELGRMHSQVWLLTSTFSVNF